MFSPEGIFSESTVTSRQQYLNTRLMFFVVTFGWQGRRFSYWLKCFPQSDHIRKGNRFGRAASGSYCLDVGNKRVQSRNFRLLQHRDVKCGKVPSSRCKSCFRPLQRINSVAKRWEIPLIHVMGRSCFSKISGLCTVCQFCSKFIKGLLHPKMYIGYLEMY